MRALWLTLVIAACAGRQTTWTPVAPPDLEDNSEAFVLIGMNALHLSRVQHVDGHVRARVVRAWRLPPAGAAAIADDDHASPEEIARGAGWQELHITDARLDVPEAVIRSALTLTGVEDDSPAWNPDDHPVIVAIVTTMLDVALAPRK